MFKLTEPFYFIRQITDHFVEHHLVQGSDARHRAQILAGSILLIMCCSILSFVLLIINYFSNPDLLIGAIITGVGSVFYLICLYTLKNTGQTTAIAHTFVTSLYISLLISSYVSGGPQASSSQILLLLPFLMFFTSGIRSGFIWSMIILATQLAIYFAYYQGFEYMQTMDEATKIEQSLVHWLITLFGIMSVSWVYEHSNQRLAIQRNLREIDNRFLTDHDLLTGLSNRQAFEQSLNNTIRLAHKQKAAFSLFLIDIQSFHQVNQDFGYRDADRILRTFAERLKNLEPNRTVARINGNQFAIITDIQSVTEDTQKRAAHYLDQLTQPIAIEHRIASLAINISCSEYPMNSTQADELFHQAEQALKQAKQSPLCFTPA